MKLTHAEYRGLIVLVIILAIITACLWLSGPKSPFKRAISNDPVLTADSIAAARTYVMHSDTIPLSDSLLRATTKSKRKKKSTSREQKKQLADRPSPLDSRLPAN